MIRVPRWATLAALGTACLAPVGCFEKASETAPGEAAPEAAKPPVEVGAALYAAAKMPVLPPPTVQPDPIAIHPAVVQYDLTVQVASQVDAQIELIATPIKPGENYDPNDPLIVRHPRNPELVYRRLRENDMVARDQTLVRLDEQVILSQVNNSIKTIEASGRVIEAGRDSFDKYKKTADITEAQYKKGVATILEMLNAQATVARLLENMIQAEVTKIKAEGERDAGQHKLRQYFCVSPVNGRITKILKSPGEVAKAGEAILEIQSTDRVRIEGNLPAEYANLVKKDMPAVIEPMVPFGPAPFNVSHRQEATAVAVTAHPGRPLVVSGGLDAIALVWDVTKTKQYTPLPHPSGVGVRAVACTGPLAKGGHWVATGADDGKVRLWDVSNPDKLPKTPAAALDDGHRTAITAAAFSPDGKYLATAAGREVFVWQVADKKKLYELPVEHRDAVTAVRFTPQATLVTVSRDRTIRNWKVGETGGTAVEALPVIDHRSGAVDVLGVSADGSKVLFDKDAARIDVLGLADGRTVGSLVNPAGNARFTGLALFSHDDRFILTAGGDADVKGELQLWDAPAVGGRASERRRLVTPGRSPVTCAAFSPDPDNQFVVVGTQAGGVHYWTPPKAGQEEKRWVGRVESVLPEHARYVKVRVVMDNPADADGLQDRSTATILLNPDGTVAAPKPPLVPKTARVDDGVIQAGAVLPTVPVSTAPGLTPTPAGPRVGPLAAPPRTDVAPPGSRESLKVPVLQPSPDR
jgi:WD40 repeat protein